MTIRDRDDSRPQGHGPDDLEPLDEQAEERQEPEDDYYIRNYVLKESSGGDKPETEETAAAGEDTPESGEVATAVSVEPAAISDEEDAEGFEDASRQEDVGSAALDAAEEPASPPAFGSQTFGPVKTETAPPVARSEPEEELDEDLSRAEVLASTLSSLLESSSDIQAAALVSLDGLAMASALPDEMAEDRVAAMSAAILGLGERASAELGQGSLNQVFVEGDDGYVFLMSAGGKAVLTALAGGDAKIGLVFYDMKHAAAKIADVL